MYSHLYVCMFINMYILASVCMYVIHTYIHTYILSIYIRMYSLVPRPSSVFITCLVLVDFSVQFFFGLLCMVSVQSHTDEHPME